MIAPRHIVSVRRRQADRQPDLHPDMSAGVFLSLCLKECATTGRHDRLFHYVSSTAHTDPRRIGLRNLSILKISQTDWMFYTLQLSQMTILCCCIYFIIIVLLLQNLGVSDFFKLV